MPEYCIICKREGEKVKTRCGICFDCAEAESIIESGLDMRDHAHNDLDLLAYSKSAKKVSFLIRKGWKPPRLK